MPLVPDCQHGTLNGTTPVEVASAPAGGTQRMVKSIVVFNIDTAPVTLTLTLIDGIHTRTIDGGIIAAGQLGVFIAGEYEVVVLTSTRSLKLVMSAGPATTNPDFLTNYADKS